MLYFLLVLDFNYILIVSRKLLEGKVHKILIVDDFEADRENLKEMLASITDIDLEIIGECENGFMACDFMAMSLPDIVFTDIEMPLMNGLELAQKVNQLYPNIKIVFCSLYDEFEYARKALYLNSYGYILKPINRDELVNCIMEVTSALDNEAHLKKEHEELKALIENNKLMLIDNFMKGIINGLGVEDQNLWDKVEYFGIRLEQNNFCLVYVEIDDYKMMVQARKVEQRQLVTLRVFEKLKEIAKDFGEFPLILIGDAHFILTLSGLDAPVIIRNAVGFAEAVAAVFKSSDLSLTACVSDICDNIHGVKDLFEECRYIMRYKYILGKGKVLTKTDIPASFLSRDIDLNMMQKDLRFLLNSGNGMEIERYIDDLLNQEVGAVSESHLRNMCFSIVMCIRFVLNEDSESINTVFKEENLIWEKLLTFETIDDAQHWIKNLLVLANEHLSKKTSKKYRIMVEEINNYIEKSYMKNIGLEQIAAELHYSPNYLNLIFKQDTGETIADCILKRKMEKAKEMLTDIHHKIYTVAEELGFSNTAYFCRVFKKYYGITPKECQEMSMP
jgi:two-component system, response regulator YesN